MDFTKIVLLALSTLLRKVTWAQDCLPISRFDPEQCLCSPRTGGWEMSCFIDEIADPAFIVDFAANSHISVKCAAVTSPYSTAMFPAFSLTKISAFGFHYCLLPNISFGAIMEGQMVYSLTFESWKNVTNLTEGHFESLNYLQRLVLKRNGLSTLPRNLFRNLTSLQDLYLNDNNLQTIDENTFDGLFNLSSLEMGNNLLQELPERIFSQLRNLKYLYLYNNKLERVPKKIFHSLQSLLVLDLSRNLLQEVPSTLFKGLTSLTKISLEANNIKEIPANLFSSTYPLTELDFSNNPQLNSLPGNLFSGLSMLKSIDLGYCDISSIPLNLFSPLRNLQTLKLCYNRITELHPGVFKANVKMEVLLLDFNFLETLPNSLFERQYLLTKLGLVRNKLRELPTGLFRNLVKLKTLRMAQNQLTSLDWSLFNSLQNLEELNLSSNKLQAVANFCFCSSLKYLDLSNNLLTSMPAIGETIRFDIQEINVEYNNIEVLHVPVLLSNAASVRLGWNNISRVYVDAITTVYNANHLSGPGPSLTGTRSPRFYLLPNPIKCDCQISDFISYITDKRDLYSDQVLPAYFPFALNLTCSGPQRLKDRELISISRSELFCPTMVGCPFPCSCYVKTQDEKLVVNCSYRGLEDIPATTPRNTNILDVSGNKLRSLDALNNRIWENLTELHLHNNSLNDFGAWDFRQDLSYVSLDMNYFGRLPEKFMNYVSGSPRIKISLADNRWICSCSVIDMKGWLIENFQKVSDISNIYCVDKTGSDKKVSVIRATKDRLCPPADTWKHETQLIVICCLVVMIPFLVFMIVAIFYRKKRDPKAILSGQPCFFRTEQWLWRKFRTIVEHRRKSMPEDPSQMGLNQRGTNPDLLRFVEEKISSLNRVPNSRLQDNLAEPGKGSSTNITGIDIATIECTFSPKYVPGPRMI